MSALVSCSRDLKSHDQDIISRIHNSKVIGLSKRSYLGSSITQCVNHNQREITLSISGLSKVPLYKNYNKVKWISAWVSLPNGKTALNSVIHFGSCNYTNMERFHTDKLYSLSYCKLCTVLHVSAVRCHQIYLQSFHTSKTPISDLHKHVYDTWILAILH